MSVSKIFGTLICDKCNKPVDKVEMGIDPITGDYGFVAFCHGKIDSCVLTRKDVGGASRISYQRAFRGNTP